MKVNPFVFAKSLLRYLQKEDLPSDIEKSIIDVMNENPSVQELYKELQNKEEIDRQLSIITSFDVDSAYNKINKKYNHKTRRYNYLFVRVAAIAALIITIFTIYWLTYDTPYNSKLIGSGTTLFKTSDGSIVNLDTLINTTLSNNLFLQNERGLLVINEIPVKRKINNKPNIIDVPYKGMYTVKLPDGTKVHLNSGSTLSFSDDYYLDERIVTLNGEAFFEVTKSEGKPFIVKTENISIKVLGTKFNVKSYDNDPNSYTTLIEGKIELLDNNKEHRVLPGEQVVFDKRTHLLDVKEVNVEPIVAWADNIFYFDNTPLDEIMRQLSRWYDLKIKYLDDNPDIRNVTYSGKIKMYTHPEDVLRKFEKAGELKFELRKNTITISKK
ncbi:DUF4974 domain-containing protein [Dysgonomonas sp. Marseille-P4677]|uniref:FecR family protein n=1 Tax=Dysgonomonas sp. Marseille-P4677 TaxID=2364790 RepID=UPI001913E0D9|nr:FecR family protein [Dysgonomonas sp. Marseille-P4677]MBK5720356.1 DUF4974 domain-containing protein [Dysgonomonas sp. Marseille-P4677]